MKGLQLAIAAGVLLTLAAAWLFVGHQPEQQAKQASIAAAVVAPTTPPASAMALAQPAPAQAPVAAPMAAQAPETKAAQFEALKRQGTASSAFAAYRLVSECAWTRRFSKPSQAACGDLTPTQIVEADVLLQRAAEGGAHWAALDYAMRINRDKPMGVPAEEYSESQWRRYVQIGAEHGDRYSIGTMAAIAANQEDWAATLKWIAAAEVARKLAPSPMDELLNDEQKKEEEQKLQETIADLSAKLTPEQAQAALAAGKTMRFKEVK
jgi:hypothetical protein